MMRVTRWIVCVAILLAIRSAHADLVDSERLELWELWREQRLDLRVASAEEIAALPGSDSNLAAAVIALRELGGLGDWDDLLAVPEIDRGDLRDWRPYVQLPAASNLRFDASAEPGRQRASWKRDGAAVEVGGVMRRDTGVVHAWVGWRGARWRFVAGDLRPRVGSRLSVDDALARSRTGPAIFPRGPTIEGRSDSAPVESWRGGSVVGEARGVRVALIAGEYAGEPAALLTLQARSGGQSTRSFMVDLRGRTPRWGALLRKSISSRAELFVEGAFQEGRSATTFAWRSTGPGFRWGVEGTRADRGGDRGIDPLTGQRLDRPQLSVQFHGRARVGSLAMEALVRRVSRGSPPDRVRAERIRLSLQWKAPRSDPGAPRWRASGEFGLDDRLDEVQPRPRLRLGVDRSAGIHRLRVAWSRTGSVADATQAASLRSTLRPKLWLAPQWDLGVAMAGEGHAVNWSMTRPLVGVLPLWVPAAGTAAWTGLELRGTSWAAGAWGWGRFATSTQYFGGGVSIRYRRRALVRRLHGDR